MHARRPARECGSAGSAGCAWGGLLTLVLAPFAVARRLVVDAGQKVEVLERHLLLLDTELVVQLPLRSILDATDGVLEGGAGLVGHVERVGAAGVGPHVGEGDLFRGALLQEQLVLVVEEENGEGSVQEALVDVRHKVAWQVASLVSTTSPRAFIYLFVATYSPTRPHPPLCFGGHVTGTLT